MKQELIYTYWDAPPLTSTADSRCHGEHHSTALPPFAHLEDGGNNPHHLFARLL